MILENTRFGRVEVPDEVTLHMPAGLIGFAGETRFVLIENELLLFAPVPGVPFP